MVRKIACAQWWRLSVALLGCVWFGLVALTAQAGSPNTSPGIDDALAKQIEADKAIKVRDQVSTPGSDVALRRLILELASGTPNYDLMSPKLAEATRQQLPQLQAYLTKLGAVRSIKFRGVGGQGQDIYDVKHEHGSWQWRIALNSNGIITGARWTTNSWNITLGTVVASAPKFPGSDSTRIRKLPLIAISYGRFFADLNSVGANLYHDAHWRFDASTSYGIFKSRYASGDSHFHGLGDIDATPRAGVNASYRVGWFSVSTRVNTDIGGKHQGTLANLEFNARYPIGQHITLSGGPGLTWADRSYMQTFFGVDAVQSLNSGLRQYTAGSGVNEIHFGVAADYRFDTHWFVGTRLSTARLQGDAAASPITEKRTQNTISTFFAYHF